MRKVNLVLLMGLLLCNALLAQNIGFQEVQPKLSSMSKISAFYETNNISYYDGLINEPEKATHYYGDGKIAANIGVYMADMIYGIGAKSFDGNRSLEAVMKLSGKLGLEDEFTQVVIKRLNTKDLKAGEADGILDEVFKESAHKLTRVDKTEIYDCMLYGNYIEKLYLITGVLKEAGNSDLSIADKSKLNKALLLLLADQAEPLHQLSKLMIGHSSDIVAHRELQNLKAAVNSFHKRATVIAELPPKEISREKQLVVITQTLGEIRERIVN